MSRFMTRTRKRRLKLLLLGLVGLAIVAPVLAKAWVHNIAKSRICNIASTPHCKVALVLGTKVLPDGRLCPLLRDRVDTAIRLYKEGKVDKLLMSGDNRFSHYNEPKRMAEYAIGKGVPQEDVAMDFAGRRTYDSIYRAKHIFGQNRLIVVSQGFHLERALFLSNKLGVDAYGVPGRWPGNIKSRVREIPACMSAIADVYVLHPSPILGRKEKI